MNCLNRTQNALAERAEIETEARAVLRASLQPLIDHIQSGRGQGDLAERALDEALAQHRANPDYAVGTYFAWHLRKLMDCT